MQWLSVAGAALAVLAAAAEASPPALVLAAAKVERRFVPDPARRVAGAAAVVSEVDAEPLPYTVLINGRRVGDAVLLKLADGVILARDSDWDRWQLRHADDASYQFEGENYHALNEAPGYRATLDAALQEARFQFASSAFQASVIGVGDSRLVHAERPSGLGGFLNYEVLGTYRDEDHASGSSSVNGQTEIGVFNPWGVATSQWLGLNLAGNRGGALPGDAGNGTRIVRLDTTLTRDLPDRIETLRFGDNIGASSLFGRPVRFGGVRWARNFATQPGFVTLPQPALGGETALPSVLDVYVDGVRRQSQEIPPGPFQIDSLPVLTGRGDVEVVVRDLLGREQIITQSYFTGARQLKAGLDDFSYEAGFVRRRFGRVGEDYGQFVAIGTHRYGFNDHFTGEARVEVLGDGTQTAGIGGVFALLPVGVLSSAYAVSHSDRGIGSLGLIGLERTVRRGLSIGARLQLTTPEFAQAGLAANAQAPARVLGANIGYTLRSVGNFGLSYLNFENRTPGLTTQALTASFTTHFRHATITLIGIDRLEPRQEYSVSFNASIPFAGRNFVSSGYRYRSSEGGDASGQAFARVQRNLPEGEGLGYRATISADHGDATAAPVSGDLATTYNGPYGTYDIEAARFDRLSAYRAGISGGLGTLGGHVFASRTINDSFAIVETGAANLNLLVHNQLSAKTGADGVAVLPSLQPYQNNSVRLDSSNVPLDIEVPTETVPAIPYFRSGVLISLPAHRTLGALIGATMPDGRPVPPGATMRLLASGEEFGVGRNGAAYVTGLSPGDNAVEVTWPGHACQLTAALPRDAAFQPDLGPFPCLESSR